MIEFHEPIGKLFPAGGPVQPAALMIGREGDVAELDQRLGERMHTMLTGPRRIGKTSVCKAACARRRADGALIIEIEVPERTVADDLLQHIIDRCHTVYPSPARGLLRAASPTFEKLLADAGIPLDLSKLGSAPPTLLQRTILAAPMRVAAAAKRPVVFFLDELQRVANYEQGEQLLMDLVDIYAGEQDTTILVDGSEERAMDALFANPVCFDKLVGRVSLPPTLAQEVWVHGLRDRFEQAKLDADDDALEAVVAFGRQRPYETMTAARYAAFAARKIQALSVDRELADIGIRDARQHLASDG